MPLVTFVWAEAHSLLTLTFTLSSSFSLLSQLIAFLLFTASIWSRQPGLTLVFGGSRLVWDLLGFYRKIRLTLCVGVEFLLNWLGLCQYCFPLWKQIKVWNVVEHVLKTLMEFKCIFAFWIFSQVIRSLCVYILNI